MAAHPCLSRSAHACALETQIRRFPRGYRRRLRKLARDSSRLGELLYSFPGLALALAAGGRHPAAQGRAIRLVKEGRPLAEAAAALELPLWMRRFPPEAFTGAVAEVALSEEFGRRIVNDIPGDAALTTMWLRWVFFGVQACDESFALWLAKQAVFRDDAADRVPLLPLAAFAWFSRADGPARGLIVRPWHANMSFATAAEETRIWLERVILDYCHDGGARNGGWFKTRKVCGFRFTPLLTAEELREEGDRMSNCVATYIPRVATGECLIYSIRRGGHRLATMEVAPSRKAPIIVQLLGVKNTPVSDDIRRAADAWLPRQGDYPIIARTPMARVPVIPARWEQIWKPYWEARPSLKAELCEPGVRTLANLRQDMNALMSIAKRR